MDASGSGGTNIQEQGSAAGGSEREGNERHMDTTRAEHTSGTRAQLAFVVWLCRSRRPSTRARRMRHSVEDKGNTASIAVVAGR